MNMKRSENMVDVGGLYGSYRAIPPAEYSIGWTNNRQNDDQQQENGATRQAAPSHNEETDRRAQSIRYLV
jgi:hypothetical protein